MSTRRRHLMILAVLAALAALAAWLALRGPAPLATAAPAFAGDATRIAYLAADKEGVYNLWTTPAPTLPSPARGRAGEGVALTRFPAGVWDYAVSPDGRWIALSVLRAPGDEGGDLWLVDNQGAGARRILACGDAQCRAPAWSPDGARLAYGRRIPLPGGDEDETIWLVAPDGTGAAPLLPAGENLGHSPRWAPAGNRLAFVEPGTGRIRVVDLDTGFQTTLDTSLGEPPAWSPDGARLVAADLVPAGEAPLTHLFIFDLAAQSSRELDSHGAAADGSPAWSPSGDLIAFGRRAPTLPSPARGLPAGLRRDFVAGEGIGLGRQIWLTRPDGSGARALTAEPGANYSALAWSPAATRLAAVRYELGTPGAVPEVWVFDTATGAGELVVNNATWPQWVP